MGTELKTEQAQKVSQDTIRQLNLLQMSAQELTDYMNAFSLENPVVELEGGEPENKEQDRLRKLEWLSELDEQNRVYYERDREDTDESEISNMGKREEETLADSLMLQLLGGPYSPRQMEIFKYIAESLDKSGYFTDSVRDTAVYLNVSQAEVGECLDIMKTLEPAGVCAGGLSECLYLQLERQEEEDELAVEKAIAKDYLELLGKDQLSNIGTALNQPLERIKEAKKRIQDLNPRPAAGFGNGERAGYVAPDVTIVKLEGYFEILVNQYSLPQLRVNQDYLRLLKSGECDPEVSGYLTENIRQVKQVRECIARRNSILAQLTRFLAERQSSFFQYGKGNLKPLGLQEAAAALEVQESVISCCVKNKYLQCCWGVFPMEYFFTKEAAEAEAPFKKE